MYFILNTEQKRLNGFDLTFEQAHIVPTLIEEKEKTKRKRSYGLSYFSFFFYAIIFNISD